MIERRIHRDGQVVERQGGPVVRFPGGCGREAVCACALGVGRPIAAGHREIPLAALGLDAVARHGDRITLSVTADGLARVAARLFALPLVALLLGAWGGQAAAAGLGVDAEAAAGLAGLTALALTSLVMATRRSSALMRPLKLNARLQRTDA